MLAYVFWHWKKRVSSAAEYEARQRAFHAALADDPADGFIESLSVGLSGASWAAGGSEAYEDWYLVRDFAALGHLNAAAVSAGRSAPHDAAAALAENGTAALYDLRAGEVIRRPNIACWFRKPQGMSYPELDAALAPVVEGCRGALWIRQMTLGPSPEFCLHSEAETSLPAGFEWMALPLRPIWPG